MFVWLAVIREQQLDNTDLLCNVNVDCCLTGRMHQITSLATARVPIVKFQDPKTYVALPTVHCVAVLIARVLN
jgi:DNA polymerase sigma